MLSEEELLLMSNSDWLLRKHTIIQKVISLFGDINTRQQSLLLSNKIDSELMQIPPKIYKGEQYQQLPYVMLDYPRIFKPEGDFAIRCLFWWGHFFSISIQLSGKYKKNYEQYLISQFSLLEQSSYHVCIHATPWEHHFTPDNMLPLRDINQMSFENIIQENTFLKISKKIPLHEWENVEEIFEKEYEFLLKIISNQAPSL